MSPPAVTSADETQLDEGLVVNGSINVRKTHPNLYLLVSTLALMSVALGLNFWIFNPAFQVYDMPNGLWGTIFLTLGIGKLVFLNLYRRLLLLRATIACSVGYLLFFGVGTAQPVLEGSASAQLLIIYVGLAALQIPLLLEPFINPWTAKR